jgi:D-beta-D-heptose 7-phosphate kinase/D-beta-D-heptose 1-phosphate adenosyltransferase
MSERLIELVEKAGNPRVLVVGDLMLDRYVWGEAIRVSPEGPIPVLRVSAREGRPGGAGNVAAALAGLGAEVSVCGVLGRDRQGEDLADQLRGLCSGADGIVAVSGRPSTVKTRYIGYVQSVGRGAQHMLRVDKETTGSIEAETEEKLLGYLEAAVPCQQAVVLSDYDKGVLTARIVRRTVELAKAQGIPVVTDPKIGRAFAHYRGSFVITPNRYETQTATGILPGDESSFQAASRALLEKSGALYALITLDRDGMFLAGKGEPGTHISTSPREVYDVTGAGDMVVSVLALMLAEGAGILDAARVANVAAGIEVSKIGAAPVARSEIVADLVGAPAC